MFGCYNWGNNTCLWKCSWSIQRPTINNTNNTSVSVDNVTSQSSSSGSADDGYKRPTRTYGGEEHLTAHESDVLDDGWDPKQHEVSRSDIGNGYHRINYDDGYFRVCDDHGYVVSYGYW